MPFWSWSKTAATNANSDSTINWAEGMSPSAVNDSARAQMARTAEWRDDVSATITTGGTSTAYTVTSNQVFDSLAHMGGALIAFVPHTTCGATVTLSVDGLGAKPLRSAPSVEIGAGVLVQGTPYAVMYNASDAAFYLRGFYGNPFNIPVGGGMFYVGATAPNSNFVLPAGQAISRTTYATLFALTSTAFGIGDGTTTFNVPDLRGRTLFALDNLNGTAANVLQVSTTLTTTSGSPTATVGSATNIAPGMVIVSANVTAGTTVSAIVSTTVTMSANATGNGSGVAARFSAMSDAQTIGATGGAQNHTLSTPELPVHTHAPTDPGHTHTVTAQTNLTQSSSSGGFSAPDVANKVYTSSSNTTGITIANAGGGLPHIVIPPAMALPFILRVI